MLNFTMFTSFLYLNWYVWLFWCMPPCLYENLQGVFFLGFSSLMREILHAWRDFFHWCGRFYMLAGRAGEIVSRRETPSQCGRVGSPALSIITTRSIAEKRITGTEKNFWNCFECSGDLGGSNNLLSQMRKKKPTDPHKESRAKKEEKGKDNEKFARHV